MAAYGHEKKANLQYIKTSPRCQGEKEGGSKKEKASRGLTLASLPGYNDAMPNANDTFLKWTHGNSKLQKTSGESFKIVGYGISADTDINGVNSCPGASACRGVCYAKQGTYLFKNVREARFFNLNASFLPEYSDMLVNDLAKVSRKYNTVRIHDSGDFHTQAYLDAWKRAASVFPNVTFYAYTKSLHLDLFSNLPVNFKLVQSLGGKYDNKVNLDMPHSRIFSDDDARIRAGYVDGNINDLPAILGDVKIGLVYHGVKKLTGPQKDYFA